MKYRLDCQIASSDEDIPNRFVLQRWVNETLEDLLDQAEVSLKIVDAEESQRLNKQYRQKDKPTNVLSFPSDIPEDVQPELPLLGDIVICAPVVKQEANEQGKTLEAHWAHMVTHGLLHLLGYDHIEDADAEKMESLETKILKRMGYPNPYQE